MGFLLKLGGLVLKHTGVLALVGKLAPLLGFLRRDPEGEVVKAAEDEAAAAEKLAEAAATEAKVAEKEAGASPS